MRKWEKVYCIVEVIEMLLVGKFRFERFEYNGSSDVCLVIGIKYFWILIIE